MITILRANALALPLADSSVDLGVTSPPYFGLRSYQDGGEHYAGQIGSEATPAEFLDALIAATREMVRVLKPSGSIWVNLGDKMSTGQPTGDVLPLAEIVFPFDRALRGVEDLSTVPVERTGEGPEIEETYVIDRHGIVTAAITDVEAGFTLTSRLGG